MITTTDIAGTNRIRAGRLNASQIAACSPDQVRAAEVAYARALAFTVNTPAQAEAAERYTALAAKSCARAGLFDRERHLYSVELRYAYLKTRLSLRL